MSLILAPNLTDHDEIYHLLIAAHEGLTKAESDALNARLILILFNHVGDPAVIREALVAAKATRVPVADEPNNQGPISPQTKGRPQ